MDVEVADFGGPWGYVEPEKPHYLGHRDRLRDRAAATTSPNWPSASTLSRRNEGWVVGVGGAGEGGA